MRFRAFSGSSERHRVCSHVLDLVLKVKWFERRVNLEPSTKGIEESEREVFELEDTDINPIGVYWDGGFYFGCDRPQ